MKYIVFRKELEMLTHLVPVIFPDTLVHADVAQAMQRTLGLHDFTPDSAGHFNPMSMAAIDQGVRDFCYGESETLSISSKPERDSRLILWNDYGAGLSE